MVVLGRAAGVPPANAASLCKLLDAGHTVPFIVRYRAGEIGGLSGEEVRAVCREREKRTACAVRRSAVLHALEISGELTDRIRAALAAASTAAEVDEV